MCVCVSESEKMRERACMCVCVCVNLFVCVCLYDRGTTVNFLHTYLYVHMICRHIQICMLNMCIYT